MIRLQISPQIHMGNRFKNAEHLIRVAAWSSLAVSCSLHRGPGCIVPKSFGQYGHYRADALKDIADRTPLSPGTGLRSLPSGVADLKKTGKHANVGCEACHGPLEKHAEDAGSVVPVKPDTKVLCVKCHEANSAKPKTFRR